MHFQDGDNKWKSPLNVHLPVNHTEKHSSNLVNIIVFMLSNCLKLVINYTVK